MKIADELHALSQSVRCLVNSGDISGDALVSPEMVGSTEDAQWQSAIDDMLGNWARHPQPQEDGVEWPSSSALNLAHGLALALRQQGLTPRLA